MNPPLSGCVALVTGAGRGIGRAIAERLAADGAAVGVVDLDADPAREVAEELNAQGAPALAVSADITRPEECAAAVARVAERFGAIHVLVNNAGLTADAMLHAMSDEQWDRVHEVVLRGAFNCTRAVAPWLRDRNGGAPPRRVVNIASVAGVHGGVGNANYAAAKGGLIALTRATAREWARYGVTANAVAPGYVETRLSERVPVAIRDALLARIPLGRAGTPADVAHAVSYLCSPGAGYVTGQVLEVHGGLTDLTVSSDRSCSP